MTATCVNEEFDCSEEDIEDEWMFSSMKRQKSLLSQLRYSALHMFELQQPTQALALIGTDRLCVGCLHPEGSTELLELGLPDKLLVSKDKESLVKDRDFRVLSGAFHDGQVECIKHLSNTRKILTTEQGKNLVTLWRLGDDKSDLVEKLITVKNPSDDLNTAQMDLSVEAEPSSVCFGSRAFNTCVADLESGKIVYETKEVSSFHKISGIRFIDANTFITCIQPTGELWVTDIRQKSARSKHIPECNSRLSHDAPVASCSASWAFDICKQCNETNIDLDKMEIIRLSSAGYLEACNLHKPADPLWSHDIGVAAKECPHLGISVNHRRTDAQVWTVSGLNGNVLVYSRAQSDLKPSLEFTHSGHAACSSHPKSTVTMATQWFPGQQDLVISSASDGSLHAWQYVSET